ncbi:hypothetical protein PULV_b0742 [Pseudoalteromonas ulvae UL12]|uniref:SDR family NAD(P)-dependent oxidoreductase n=1 Tax=Pseudoalteromonas ulvae TaxID=107327 RepID=UPI00186BA4DC|nr:SDR family NAD(P)-dependent oxidoreductase [Pseudoalteromonas ulvae]MBE0366017.1 hypothetical protein [Pseudoalteromonas ulvae UL12]
MTSQSNTHRQVLVIGASSAIAKALIDTLLDDETVSHIYGVSGQAQTIKHYRYTAIQTDYCEQNIKKITSDLKELPGYFSDVFICNGVLHSDQFMPEKKLEDINQNQLSQLLTSNTVIPMLWIQHLITLCKSEHTCHIVVLSARVGSISDNRLGGWYSYRMSKAALNMGLKTAAIEYARRAKNIKLVAFHPGTTDTPLSKPFQNNLAEGQLFTPSFVARSLLTILSNTRPDGTLSYIDWAGKPIHW